jgi:uncharacterized RDD family membrane protein YckC
VAAAGVPPGVALAGLGQRLLAQVIDAFVFSVLLLPVTLLGLWANDGEALSRGAEFMLELIVMLVVLIFWVRDQATPGKRVLGLRIVDADSLGAPRFAQYLSRYVGYLVASLPLGLGLLWALWDPRRQGWQDKLANTLVVRVGPAGSQGSTPPRG